MKIDVLDKGYVSLVESWGSDIAIIEAARMSTNKGFEGWGPFPCLECKQENNEHCKKCKGTGQIEGDTKLLRYLWEHKHTTPFEMAGFQVEVYAPIFVYREWHRHRTFSYNEMSGRYTTLPNDYYVPSNERLMNSAQGKKNRQGSETGFTYDKASMLSKLFVSSYEDSRSRYESLLAQGVSREVARMVLPVSQYSRMRAQAVLLNWFHFLRLRLAPNAQWEIQQYAIAVEQILKEKFPRTHALFVKETV